MVKAIDSVTRAMQVLEVLQKSSPLSLSELQRSTGINKATLLRILKTLSLSGWVIRSLSENKYSLSSSILEDTPPKSQEARLAEASVQVLDELYQMLRCPSDIAIRDEGTMRLIETTRSRTDYIDKRLYNGCKPTFLYSGVGRCYLAFCSLTEQQNIINQLKKSSDKQGKLAHDTIWLNQMIAQTRALGYGVRQSSYYNTRTTTGELLESIAVPIKDRVGNILGCLSVSWPQGRVEISSLEKKVLPHLQRAALRISERMP
ncbi:IclR family transcriptional regulator domain-containing protein [Marinomonas algicola]|uniref:IclR family transcriptional regulator domain-containing protein n=1 Tax=Marinomonas algicola TaxID=2773454 RepID=UPI001748839D|nr:IclR family transcriptional regulator C-terminal domain-containing protein [Marinomonas algicola]